MATRAYGHLFIQPLSPGEDPVMIGSVWSDTTANTLKVCTSVSPYTFASIGGSAHNLLDGSVHGDTVAQSVTRGSLVYGNSTPKWDELVIGAANSVLWTDGTDPSWSVAPVLATSLTVPIVYGSAASNGDLTIHGTSDSTRTTSWIYMQPTAGGVMIGSATTPAATTLLYVKGATDANSRTGIFEAASGTSRVLIQGAVGSQAGLQLGNGSVTFMFYMIAADSEVRLSDGAQDIIGWNRNLDSQSIGTSNWPSTGSKFLIFGDGDVPATMGSNTAGIYANDVSGTVNMYAINEAGESTRLSFPAPQTYTETNVTTDRAYDANSTSIDEIADVLGTLIADLRARGITA